MKHYLIIVKTSMSLEEASELKLSIEDEIDNNPDVSLVQIADSNNVVIAPLDTPLPINFNCIVMHLCIGD